MGDARQLHRQKVFFGVFWYQFAPCALRTVKRHRHSFCSLDWQSGGWGRCRKNVLWHLSVFILSENFFQHPHPSQFCSGEGEWDYSGSCTHSLHARCLLKDIGAATGPSHLPHSQFLVFNFPSSA